MFVFSFDIYTIIIKNYTQYVEYNYTEVPVEPRSRLVTPGFRDLDNLMGVLRRDAPTLPLEALYFMLQMSASNGWRLVSKAVEAAFLSGAYFDREVYVVAPRGGLPAIEEYDMPFIPEGTVMQLNKSMPGLADAGLEWHKEHRRGIMSCGLKESKVAKAMYLYTRDQGNGRYALEGIVGSHVDDDIMTGSDYFFDEIVAKGLDKTFHYGKVQVDKLTHTGLDIVRHDDGRITVNQADYAAGLKKIHIDASRRRQPELAATDTEKAAMRAGNGKIAWLVRNTRPDLAFDLAISQQAINSATVATVKHFNQMVALAVKDKHITIQVFPIELGELAVIAWCDASFANRLSETVPDDGSDEPPCPLESQAGYVIGFTSKKALAEGGGHVSIVMWLSHKLKRKVRSTLAAESMAANECVEAADIIRAHIAEALCGDPEGFDRRQWREAIKDIPAALVTDCRSMFDYLNKRGSTPSEKRLRLDLEILRDQLDEDSLTLRWVATIMMVADALTKGSREAFLYLRMVLETGVFSLKADPTIESRMSDYKTELKAQRRQTFEETQLRRSTTARTASTTPTAQTAHVAMMVTHTGPSVYVMNTLAADDMTMKIHVVTFIFWTLGAFIVGAMTTCIGLYVFGFFEGGDDHEPEVSDAGTQVQPESEPVEETAMPERRGTAATSSTVPTQDAAIAPTTPASEALRLRVPLTTQKTMNWLRRGLPPGRVRVPNPVFAVRGHGRPEIVINEQRPETCRHFTGWISSHGSNQYGRRWTCCACGSVLLTPHSDRRDLIND